MDVSVANSVIIQIIKPAGLKVIGSAGSDATVKYGKSEFGVDVVFSYKTSSVWDVLEENGPTRICTGDSALWIRERVNRRRERAMRHQGMGIHRISKSLTDPIPQMQNMPLGLARSLILNAFPYHNLVKEEGLKEFQEEHLPVVWEGKIKATERRFFWTQEC